MKRRKLRTYHRTAALLGAQPHGRYVAAPRWSLPHVSWKVAVPLTLILGALLWLMLDSRWYLMGENLQVTGTASNSLAKEVALASDLLGWHGFLLRPQAAGDLVLEKVPGVLRAQATCQRFPAGCIIEVEERTPHLVWITSTGTYWADRNGTLFTALQDRPDLPAVRGPLPDAEGKVVPVSILQGIEAMATLPISATVLEYDSQHGLIWTDPEGRRVAFGDGPEMAARWQIYQALVAHLDETGIFPWTVDVRFPAGPTYSLNRSW